MAMHNITFVNKVNFVKLYNNFVLKWLIFALYVFVVPEQILLGSIWRILKGFMTSVQWVYMFVNFSVNNDGMHVNM
jgi:hypothetical protein